MHSSMSRGNRTRASARARIQDLPIELLQEVFIYACTDGGRTGCSLSSVSSAFRAAVYPIRYNSIALTGTAQIASFTAHYQHIRAAAARSAHPENYPKVRHLYAMSHREMLQRRAREHDDTDTDLDHAFAAMAVGPASRHARALAPLPALLRLVARDLRTLALATTYAHTTLFAGCGTFHALRELTIARAQGVDVPTVGAPALRVSLFPALEKLHIAMCVLDHSLEHLFCHWTELAPRVRVLRLSDVPRRAASGMRETFGGWPVSLDSSVTLIVRRRRTPAEL